MHIFQKEIVMKRVRHCLPLLSFEKNNRSKEEKDKAE
jgi:hypothetical protein